MTSTEATPESDSREIAKLLAKRLIQRRDVKAVQSSTGAYKPIHSKWTGKDVVNHIEGRVTLGHYLLDDHDLTRVCAFDIDFDEEVMFEGKSINPRKVFCHPHHPAKKFLNAQVRGLGDGLAFRLKRHYPQLIVLTSFSGSKGVHVLGCFPKATTGRAARTVVTSVLESFGCFEKSRGKNFWVHSMGEYPGMAVETFPKQVSSGNGGFGNLLRVPLGINQKTGAEGFFYDPTAPIDQLVADDPIQALRQGSIR